MACLILENTIMQSLETSVQSALRYFIDLLVKAKTDFHELFTKTYGVMYQQNSKIALKLFDDLVSYYSTGNPDLSKLLDDFFLRLYMTLFEVTHRHYKFTDKHISCIKGMMDELQPFGNVPRRLSAEVKRAFVASRIFVQALAVGSNIMKAMMKIGVISDCTKALMKMSYCPQCHGYVDLKPCNSYCLNVMKGCLVYHSELTPEWENYIGKLIKLSTRLEDAFNIEDVVNPINLEISHAIMNYQENTVKISEKVLEKCGKGVIMRKRNTDGIIKHETYKFPGGKNDFSSQKSGKASGIGLRNHIADIRKKVKVLRNYWKNLPIQMCSNDNVAAKPIIQDDCWNGIDKARYKQKIIGDGLLNQSENPEVSLNIHKQNTEVNDLIISLKLTSIRLAQAHDGIYVNWTGSELASIENLEFDDLISSADFKQLEDKFDDPIVAGSGSGSDEECLDGDKCDDNPESTFTITGPTTSTEKPQPVTPNPTPKTTPNIPVRTTKIAETSTTKKISTKRISTTVSLFTSTIRPEVVEDTFEISSGSGSGYQDSDDEDIYTSKRNPHVVVTEKKPIPERPFSPHRGAQKKPYESTTYIVPHSTRDFKSDNTDIYFPNSNSEPGSRAPYDPYKNIDNESDKTTKKSSHSSSTRSWSMQSLVLLIVSCVISYFTFKMSFLRRRTNNSKNDSQPEKSSQSQQKLSENDKSSEGTNFTEKHIDGSADIIKISTGTFWMTRIIFFRCLGFIYFIAFLIALNQNDALIGSNGLLPAELHLKQIEDHSKDKLESFFRAPSVFWLLNDWTFLDYYLYIITCLGLAISFVVMVTGTANMIAMFILWVFYMSIVNIGQTWYSFGKYCFNLISDKFVHRAEVIFIELKFLRIFGTNLLISLASFSTVILEELTQPVPSPISYYMHQSPEIFHKFETLSNHFIELVVPWFTFLFRKGQIFCGIFQILFQILLIISGNLSFLNWLTMLPAICYFDDASLAMFFNHAAKKKVMNLQKKKINSGKIKKTVHLILGISIIYLSIPVVVNLFSSKQKMNYNFDPFRIVNTYGAFGSVTKMRSEVILQGTYSTDPNDPSASWLEYEFKCKPGNVTKRPCLISPYHYRLDWLAWFAAFQNYQYNPWLIHLAAKLMVNDRKTELLLSYNPFEGRKPPRYVRAEHYKYTFTKVGSKSAADGKWWKRKRIGSYFPPVSLSDLKNIFTNFNWKIPDNPYS
ncbi:Lipase maturation factor 1 [Nymphon striatum]|nr:Lipase maturation factor 1 [Nymphon striatum]